MLLLERGCTTNSCPGHQSCCSGFTAFWRGSWKQSQASYGCVRWAGVLANYSRSRRRKPLWGLPQCCGLRPWSCDKTGLRPVPVLVLVLQFRSWSWSWSCTSGLGLGLKILVLFPIVKMINTANNQLLILNLY